jgi:hypothetical protein
MLGFSLAGSQGFGFSEHLRASVLLRRFCLPGIRCQSRVSSRSGFLNRYGAEVAAIFLDEDSGRWRIISKAEPKFRRDFIRGNFHAGTGKLRKSR